MLYLQKMFDKCSIEYYFLNPPLCPILLKEKLFLNVSTNSTKQIRNKKLWTNFVHFFQNKSLGKFLELFVILLQIQQILLNFRKNHQISNTTKLKTKKKPRITIKENGTWTYTHYVNLIGAFILWHCTTLSFAHEVFLMGWICPIETSFLTL